MILKTKQKIFASLLCMGFLWQLQSNNMVEAVSDTDKKQPMSNSEIEEKRKSIREDLMLPSLSGIRGIAYRVVGYQNYKPLELKMGEELAKLKIPLVPFLEMKDGHNPCDAIAQITFYKLGSNSFAEFRLTQWVSLIRNQKIHVRAVTYSEKAFLVKEKPEQAISDLTIKFVNDFKKANEQNFLTEKISKLAQEEKKAKSKIK